MDPARIAFLTGLGINRMSLGIQDFDPDVQLAVNRLQSEIGHRRHHRRRQKQRREVTVGRPDLRAAATESGLASPARWIASSICLPDRISLYSYAHLPARFKTQRQIKEEQLPNAETKLMLLQLAVETLTDAGYVHVGMDHFAKPDDELVLAQQNGGLHRNFQGYTTHGHCDLIGLGISAISSVGNLYCQNVKTLDEYVETIDNNRHPVERGTVAERRRQDGPRTDRHAHVPLRTRHQCLRGKPGTSILKAAFPEAWPRLESLAADDLLELPADDDAPALAANNAGGPLPDSKRGHGVRPLPAAADDRVLKSHLNHRETGTRSHRRCRGPASVLLIRKGNGP